MNLTSRVNHVLSMLVNLLLAIRYGPSLRSGPNLMVLVKGLPTYTKCSKKLFLNLNWLYRNLSA